MDKNDKKKSKETRKQVGYRPPIEVYDKLKKAADSHHKTLAQFLNDSADSVQLRPEIAEMVCEEATRRGKSYSVTLNELLNETIVLMRRERKR